MDISEVPKYKGIFDCFSKLVKEKGILGLYKGYWGFIGYELISVALVTLLGSLLCRYLRLETKKDFVLRQFVLFGGHCSLMFHIETNRQMGMIDVKLFREAEEDFYSMYSGLRLTMLTNIVKIALTNFLT